MDRAIAENLPNNYWIKEVFVLSGSYSLKNGDENYSEYLDALSDLFEKYSKDNVLTIANKTVAYIGKMD